MTNENSNIELNVPFHTEKYWDTFYKENLSLQYDWYFELNLLKTNNFDLKNLNQESEILLLGIGNSSLLDFFIKNKFNYITSLDFSPIIINYLKIKYENIEQTSEYDCK